MQELVLPLQSDFTLQQSKWTLDTIQAMIDSGREEALTLEYKASEALSNNKELVKDVSAFANSDGGTIIYGVIEENHKPVRIDEGIDPTKKIRESIENTILDSIRPRISGLKIYPIDLPTGNQLFVIEIPKSTQAPHMVSHRYYKRYNFQSVPMEHYEVLDVMNRRVGPDLWIDLIPNPNEDRQWTSGKFTIKLPIFNKGIEPAKHLQVMVWLDTKLTESSGLDKVDFLQVDRIVLKDDSGQEIINVPAIKYGFVFTAEPPIFGHYPYSFIERYPQAGKWTEFDGWNIELKDPIFDNLEAFIKWEIRCPYMVPRIGIHKFSSSASDGRLRHEVFYRGIATHE